MARSKCKADEIRGACLKDGEEWVCRDCLTSEELNELTEEETVFSGEIRTERKTYPLCDRCKKRIDV